VSGVRGQSREAAKVVAEKPEVEEVEGWYFAAEGLPYHHLRSPWKQKKILLTKKPVFTIRMIINLECHRNIAGETYGIFHYAS
jgi:hypothetical protein